MRVLLCRARADAERTARRLAESGHDAVMAPVLDIATLSPDFAPFGTLDALVMTSLHAAAALDEADVRRWVAHPVYAVGRQTAAAARGRGFRDVRVGAGEAAGLVDLVRLTGRPEGRLLYLAGRVRKPGLETALRQAGYTLDVAEVYDAVEAPPWDALVRSQISTGSLDACLHFSRRSASLAVRYAGQAAVGQAFARLHHLCLSDDVAVPLRDAALSNVLAADQPSETSVLTLLGRIA